MTGRISTYRLFSLFRTTAIFPVPFFLFFLGMDLDGCRLLPQRQTHFFLHGHRLSHVAIKLQHGPDVQLVSLKSQAAKAFGLSRVDWNGGSSVRALFAKRRYFTFSNCTTFFPILESLLSSRLSVSSFKPPAQRCYGPFRACLSRRKSCRSSTSLPKVLGSSLMLFFSACNFFSFVKCPMVCGISSRPFPMRPISVSSRRYPISPAALRFCSRRETNSREVRSGCRSARVALSAGFCASKARSAAALRQKMWGMHWPAAGCPPAAAGHLQVSQVSQCRKGEFASDYCEDKVH